MLLQANTSTSLLHVQQAFDSKDQAIRFLIHELAEAGKISSEEAFYEAVIAREGLSPTGFEGGLAIPHGKSDSVREASFAIATLTKPITDWESIDPANKVELVILLAIPSAEAGSTHLTLLAEFVTRLSNEDYKNRLLQSRSAEDLLAALDASVDEKTDSTAEVPSSGKLVLAVTACPAGIAHTYMAAEALIKAGRELGIEVKVEKQGANGIEDRHAAKDLQQADAVIFAVDVAVKDEARFKGIPSIKTSVAAPLRSAKDLLEKALTKSENVKSDADRMADEADEEPTNWKSEVKASLLTDISHIIPVIVAGGMTLAVAVFISQLFDLQALYAEEGSWLWLLRQLGGSLLGQLMIPILAAYMAYSIADKPALGPGFAAGVAANLIGSGFLGGMLGGLLAGYFLKFLKQKVKPKGTFAGFISFWFYPVVGTLVVGSIMLFVVGRPLAYLNTGLISWLDGLEGANALLLGAIIGAMVSFDLGGPINKAAYTFCIGAMASGNLIPYATFASVKMVSAFAVTGATRLGKEAFTKEEREIGKQTWLLGLAGITEGAIPFMINDPLRVIPSLVAGSAVTGAIVAYFGIGLNVPGAGIFSLALLQGQPLVLAASVWLGAALVGAFISMVLLLLTRKHKNKKHQDALKNVA